MSAMSTSYPSPVSSASSPTILSLESNLAGTHSEAYVRTQSDLVAARRHASFRAAYRRIRQVRRSLFELPDVDLGPSHEAIFLAGSSVEDNGIRQWPRDIEPSQVHEGEGERHPRPPRPSVNTNYEQPPGWTLLNSPVSPPRLNAVARRSLLESQMTRRRDLLDDRSTFLGRHVAAREAAASTATSNAAEAARRIERDLEIIRSIARQRLSEPGIGSEGSLPAENDRTTRSLDANVLRGPHLTTSPIAFRGVGGFRTRRPLRSDSRQSSTPSSGSQVADRLSLLSNLSVQNLSTPTSTVYRGERLLLLEDSNYVLSPTTYSQEDEDIHGLSVRREEAAHNTTLESDEDQQAWLPATRQLSYLSRSARRGPGTRPPSSQREANTSLRPSDRLRRNWARVDPDGDFLSWYEDEELDATRNVQQQNNRVSALLPLTRDAFPPGDEVEESPRVRINSRDMDTGADAALPNIAGCSIKDRSITELFGTDTPLYIDPLPTPLERMVPSRKMPSSEFVPVHSRFAVFAGR